MEETQVIKTVGENGEEIELKLLEIVNVEGKDYALLLPSGDVEDEESEVVLMRLKQENDEYIFETIEDNDEFNSIAQAISEEDECDCGECDCQDDECSCGCKE